MEARYVVTTRCNFKCIFCLNEFVGPPRSLRQLRAKDYGLLTKAVNGAGFIEKITISGGEPLVRSDFGDLISCIRNNTPLPLTVVTNGFYIDRYLESFHHVEEVHVSFHSMNDRQWQLLTHSTGRRTVEKNIILLRNTYPGKSIKLNVVADKSNASEIEEYLEFAREYRLQINVFKEGIDSFKELSRLLGVDGYNREPSEFWDLTTYHPHLLRSSRQKNTYLVDGVQITLSYTSTDERRWYSIWLSPEGLMFADVTHQTPEIETVDHLENEDYLNSAFNSMKSEMEQRKETRSEYSEKQIIQEVARQRAIFKTGNVLNLLSTHSSVHLANS